MELIRKFFIKSPKDGHLSFSLRHDNINTTLIFIGVIILAVKL